MGGEEGAEGRGVPAVPRGNINPDRPIHRFPSQSPLLFMRFMVPRGERRRRESILFFSLFPTQIQPPFHAV